MKLHNSSALKTQTQTFTREKTLNSQWGEIHIAIKTSLFSASNLFSFTLYLSDNKYGVVFIMHLLYICLGHMWWHFCLNFSLFCLSTNVISDLSNICLLAKYSQIHDFIQWSHRYRGGHWFESRWSPDFFQASHFQLLKLENLLRWSLFTSLTSFGNWQSNG